MDPAPETPASFAQNAAARNDFFRSPKLVWFGGLVLLLAYGPALAAYGAHLWDRPHFQFFPLAVAGAVALAWRGLKENLPAPERSSPRAMRVLLAIALVLLLASAFAVSPWLGVISALFLVAALALGAGGRPFLAAQIPALAMILVLVCLPLRWDSAFVFGLRRFAVMASGVVLDALRVPYFLSGNIVEIRNAKLLVNEACSGINSALFIVALSLFYGFWRRRSLRHALAVMVASLSFVLLGNVLRISAGAALRHRWDIDILTGWRHEAVGLVLFAAYAGLILSADALCLFLRNLVPAKTPSAAPAPAAPSAVLRPVLADVAALLHNAVRPVPARLILPLCILFAGAGVFQAWQLFARHHFGLSVLAAHGAARLKADATFTLPDQLAGWERLESNQYDASLQERALEGNAIRTHSWAYRSGPLVMLISLDYPYRVYHDLTECYIGSGWEIGDSKTGSDASGASFTEIEMRKKPFANGYLLCGAFGADGRWSDGATGQLRARLGEQTGPVHQVQALVATSIPLTSEQKREARRVFEEARQRLIEQALPQMESKP